jgi:hypothetical protein
VNESIRRVTDDFRWGTAPHWRALLDKASVEGIDSERSAIAIAWPDDVSVIEGFLVTQEDVFNFELNLGASAAVARPKVAYVTSWRTATEDERQEFSSELALARALLAADA